jgi:hypothetical protein
MSRTQSVHPTEFRPDGWPLCPICKCDELYSLDLPATIETIVGCYRCGPVRIAKGESILKTDVDIAVENWHARASELEAKLASIREEFDAFVDFAEDVAHGHTGTLALQEAVDQYRARKQGRP